MSFLQRIRNTHFPFYTKTKLFQPLITHMLQLFGREYFSRPGAISKKQAQRMNKRNVNFIPLHVLELFALGLLTFHRFLHRCSHFGQQDIICFNNYNLWRHCWSMLTELVGSYAKKAPNITTKKEAWPCNRKGNSSPRSPQRVWKSYCTFLNNNIIHSQHEEKRDFFRTSATSRHNARIWK